jgi:hypothetical protein
MNTRIRWSAQLQHVREVSVIGTANLSYWQDRLRKEDLSPADDNGQATILIVAAAGTYLRCPFRELSISVRVHRHPGGNDNHTYFLIQAFNSNRFFAFCERTLFSTPYDHAVIAVEHENPTSVHVAKRHKSLLSASMSAQHSAPSRSPLRERHEAIDACILLPRPKHRARTASRMFFARLSGYTRTFAFQRECDTLSIGDTSDDECCGGLAESDFVATTWMIRSDANHSKSKTYLTSDFQ